MKDKRKFDDQKRHDDRFLHLQFKLLWAEAFLAQTSWQDYSIKLDAMKQKVDAAESINLPLKVLLDKLDAEAKDAGQMHTALGNDYLSARKKLIHAISVDTDLQIASETKMAEIDALEADHKTRKTEYKQIAAKISAEEVELKLLIDNPPQLVDQILSKSRETAAKEKQKDLSNEKMESERTLRSFEKMKRSLDSRVQEKDTEISDLEKTSTERLNRLKANHQSGPLVSQILQWLEQNKGIFEFHVYGPLILDINCRDTQHAKYIEQAISYQNKVSFICQSRSDRSQLLAQFHRLGVKGIPVFNIDVNRSTTSYVPYPIDEFRCDGVENYLCDIVSAPKVVKEMLSIHCGFQGALVGTSLAARNTEKKDLIKRIVHKTNRALNLYTPSLLYTNQRSNYGNRAITTAVRPVSSSSQYLCYRTDKVADAVEKLRAQRQQLVKETEGVVMEIEKLKQRMSEISCEVIKYEKIVQTIIGERRAMALYNSEIKRKANCIERLKSQREDIALEIKAGSVQGRERIRHEMSAINASRVEQFSNLVELAAAICMKARVKDDCIFMIDQLKRQKVSKQLELQEATNTYRILTDSYHNGIERLKSLDEVRKAKKAAAEADRGPYEVCHCRVTCMRKTMAKCKTKTYADFVATIQEEADGVEMEVNAIRRNMNEAREARDLISYNNNSLERFKQIEKETANVNERAGMVLAHLTDKKANLVRISMLQCIVYN